MEECRDKALREPLRLQQNWFAATLVVLAWLAALEWAIYYGFGHYGSKAVRQYTYPAMAAVGGVGVGAFALFAALSCRREWQRRQSQRQPLLSTA